MAAGLFGELRSKFLLLVFEFFELNLNELMTPQHRVKSGEELRTEALFADLQSGLEPLGLGFEFSDLRIGERKHASRVCDPGGEGEPVSSATETEQHQQKYLD